MWWIETDRKTVVKPVLLYPTPGRAPIEKGFPFPISGAPDRSGQRLRASFRGRSRSNRGTGRGRGGLRGVGPARQDRHEEHQGAEPVKQGVHHEGGDQAPRSLIDRPEAER